MARRVRGRSDAAARAVAFAAVMPLLAGCADPFPTLTYAERYCYRTLAEVDCHDRPLAGEENRRVGFYDQPIAADYEPWPQHLF